ncbi:MAG: YraN family protein [Candidatus Glassbacteria bacterium]|nr:YraN family protein [Candidatus Glassbacteria bacterium]
MKDRQRKGLDGEEAAAGYLRSQGYDLLEHRYRFGHKEIDLIARKDDLVVFVEVKARRSDSFGPASLSITAGKKSNLVAAAEGYLLEKDLTDSPGRFRFDVILLHPPGSDGEVRLEHIIDAFRP